MKGVSLMKKLSQILMLLLIVSLVACRGAAEPSPEEKTPSPTAEVPAVIEREALLRYGTAQTARSCFFFEYNISILEMIGN